MSEAARVREVWRYFPTAIQNALNVSESQHVLNEPFDASQHGSSLVDASLTCFAQLCALRLNASNCYVSLLDQQRQYVLAEATAASLLRRHEQDTRLAEKGIWLGATCLPLGRLVSSYLWSTSLLHDPAVDHIVVDDLLQLDPYRDGSIAQESPPKRGYAAVPLRSKRGFTIGLLCAFFKEPRTSESEPVDISLMQDIAASVMENLELRCAQEESQRVGNMTRGLIRFIDSTASPSPAQDFADSSSTIQDVQNSPQQSRKPSSQMSPGSLGNGTRGETGFFRRKARSSGHHTASPPLSDAKHEPLFGTQKDRPSSSGKDLHNTSQTKTTATMKNLLPIQGEAMFTRAAQIIRETSDLDGVIVFDASIAALNQPRATRVLKTNEQAFSRSTADFETHRSVKSLSSREDESATSDTSGSQNSESKARQTCRILGYSGSSAAIQKIHEDCFSLPEVALRRMLRTYPDGKIINYSFDGQPSSEDSGSTPEGRHLPNSSTKKRGGKQSITLQAIHAAASGATSLAFVPLWDYQRSRYFACCLCWTTRIGRLLSPRLDLAFYKAFGNSIMTELSRLDAYTSDAAKTTFVASISHELRSPLHGIMGAAEFLADTDLDSFQVNMLHTITTSGRTLLDTLNHVMDYSKMNQHFDNRPRSTVELKDVGHIRLTATRRIRGNTYSYLNDATTASDLAVLAEEVVEAVYASQSYRLVASGIEDNDMSHIKASAGRGTSVVFGDNTSQNGADISEVLSPEADLGVPMLPDSSSFEVDSGRKVVRVILDIEQHQDWSFAIASGVARRVIMNILGNALKFTTSGYVKVSLSASKNLPGLNAKDTQVTLTISDTGRGMSNDFIVNRLFNAFQQEDSFSSGIGLGMHIVRQLIETVGGRIEIRSRPKHGTEMQVKFNLSKGTEPKLLDDIREIQPDRNTLIGKKAFILDVTSAMLANPSSEESEANVSHKRIAAKFVTDSLSRTLRDWLQMDVTSGATWTNPDVDFVLCTEASFYHLRAVTQKVEGRKTIPIVLFVAVDALEAAALRNDVRVQSDEFVCGICVQPLGPLKMTDVLTQCWQRREDLCQSKLTESVGSMSPVSAGASRSVDSTPMYAPPKRPNLRRAQSGQSVHQINETGLPIRNADTSSHPSTSGPRASSPSPPVSTTIASPGQRIVLITDDNAINRRLLIAFMKRHQIPYVEALNGLIALNLYKASPSIFHIILMDLSMPVMDGMTATRRIRSFEREMGLSKVPIIALTGLTSDATRKEAYDSGFDNYLTKPVNFGHLLGWIKMDCVSQPSRDAGGRSAQATPLETPMVDGVTDVVTPTLTP